MDQSTITLASGGNKGLGFESARGLARAGHHVLIGCRNVAQGDAAAATLLGEAAGQVEALLLDVTDGGSVQAAAASIERRFGRLDGLVNNAGVALDRQVGETSLRAMMRATFEVNVFGLACPTEAMIPLLVHSAHPRIVNMSSGLGSLANNTDPDYEFAQIKPAAYNASKSAVTMLTVIYAARLRDQGFQGERRRPGLLRDRPQRPRRLPNRRTGCGGRDPARPPRRRRSGALVTPRDGAARRSTMTPFRDRRR